MEFHLKTDSDLKLSALISELMRLVDQDFLVDF